MAATKVAPPAIIAQTGAALLDQIAARTDIDQEAAANAVGKAMEQLIAGVRHRREGPIFFFASRSREGRIEHRTDRDTCSCETGQKGIACWHRAARYLIIVLTRRQARATAEAAERAGDLPPPPAYCRHCYYRMPDPPTPRKALRRALITWIQERAEAGAMAAIAGSGEIDEDAPGSGKAMRTLIRVVNKRRSKYMTFALVAEEIDFVALRLEYGTQIRILLDKEKETMLCTTEARGVIAAENEARQITAELMPYWTKYRDLYISGDLSRMVRNIVSEMNAAPLRKEGGLYLVPADQEPSLRRLMHVIETLPTDRQAEPYLVAVAVPDEAQAKRQLARAVHAGFMDELAVLTTDLERFIQAKPGSVQPATIAERLSAYKLMRGKAQTYADLLTMQQVQIEQRLAELEARARAILLAEPEDESTEECTDTHVSVHSLPSPPAAMIERRCDDE